MGEIGNTDSIEMWFSCEDWAYIVEALRLKAMHAHQHACGDEMQRCLEMLQEICSVLGVDNPLDM